jgi:hypothetical protein
MKFQLKDLPQLISVAIKKVARYRVIIFVLLIGSVYGYVLFTINSLSSVQPSSDTITTELNSIKSPKIDQAVVKQLQTLRDNSVSVQALFEEARNNPFNE